MKHKDDLLFDAAGEAVIDGSGEQQRRAAAHFDVTRAVLARFGWRHSGPDYSVLEHVHGPKHAHR